MLIYPTFPDNYGNYVPSVPAYCATTTSWALWLLIKVDVISSLMLVLLA